jgi:hypothetical protein
MMEPVNSVAAPPTPAASDSQGICRKCCNTGWAFMPHSDEARERCDCPHGDALPRPHLFHHSV